MGGGSPQPKRRRLKIRFLHREQAIPPERLQATVMIHLGLAWRSHLDGDTIGAIRRLSMAAEAIMQLIEEWSGTDLKTEVTLDGGAADRQ